MKTYHTSAISTSPNTVVIRLPQSHYERLFTNKNPQTVSMISHNIGFNVQQRLASELICKNVPLLKAVMLQLDDVNGTHVVKRKVVEEEDDASDEVTEPDLVSSVRSPSKIKSAPATSRHEKSTGVEEEVMAMTKNASNGNLSSLPEALQKYLNTQIKYALDDTPTAETDEGLKDPSSEQYSSGVYTLAKHTPADSGPKKSELPSPLTARHGIFFKMLQVSNPHIDKRHLAIEEEEYTYLCQLRRRIAKNLNEYYPFASLESFLQLGDDTPKTGRLCRKGQLANQLSRDTEKPSVAKRSQTARNPRRPIPQNTTAKTALRRSVDHVDDARRSAHVRFS